MSSSSGNQQATWARAEDWTRCRQIITDLWFIENRPLKQVDKIMKEQYNFRATTRMYKNQLEKWGLRKNVQRKDALYPIAISSTANGASSNCRATLNPEKEMPPGQWKLASRKKPSMVKTTDSVAAVIVGNSAAASEPPFPILPTLELPSQFKLPEECMYLIKHYVQHDSQFRHLKTSSRFRSTSKSELWMNKIILGSRLISAGQYDLGFGVINFCFDQYKDFMLYQDPWLIFSTYSALLHLAQTEHRLGQIFIQFLDRMAHLNIKSPHPLHRLFTIIKQAGIVSSRDHAIPVMKSFLGVVSHDVSSSELFTMRSILKIIERAPISPIIRLTMSDETVEGVIAQLRHTVPQKDVLVDIYNTKTGLRNAFVCQPQRDANSSVTSNGVLVTDYIVDEQADMVDASIQYVEVMDWFSDNMAKFTALELRSKRFSATANWSALEVCIRKTGDQAALRQLMDIYPAIKAGMLKIITWAR